MMKTCVVLLALVPFCFSVPCSNVNPPKWPKTYSVRGVIRIPYAEVEEPFMAYYDGTVGSSRIDYYGGMTKTYQISSLGDFGTTMKIVPITTETTTNVLTCMQVNGTKENKVMAQISLPDLSTFTCVGGDMINGLEAEKWALISKEGEKLNKYYMWIQWDKSDEKAPRPVPIRFDMKGYNTLFMSHYDHYYLTYDLYSSDAIDPSVWEVDPKLKCSVFPGLGMSTIASFNPMKELINHFEDHIENSWEKFKKNFDKKYKTDSEHHNRKLIFKNNHRFVNSINRRGLSFKVKLNHYADWTRTEMKILRGLRSSKGNDSSDRFPYTKEDVAQLAGSLPDSLDWRSYGAVTPVKDQSICGSCWSFGTTGAMEGAYFVKTGILLSFSQQALVDCSWGFDNHGCDGGDASGSLQWIKKHKGIPLEDEYGQYLGQDGFCHIDQVKLAAPITGYVNVTSNDANALKLALFKHGPVYIAIDASPRTFLFYSHGVYNDPDCLNKPEDLDHAVLAVGYGTLLGKPYWLVKNSWSNMWGNGGYVLIGAENNVCGVTTAPVYVTM